MNLNDSKDCPGPKPSAKIALKIILVSLIAIQIHHAGVDFTQV